MDRETKRKAEETLAFWSNAGAGVLLVAFVAWLLVKAGTAPGIESLTHDRVYLGAIFACIPIAFLVGVTVGLRCRVRR